jgi:hypothetical protein
VHRASFATALVAAMLSVAAQSLAQNVRSTSKACGFLPLAELQFHFGAKATEVRGSEIGTTSLCSADLPDRLHGANLTANPPGNATMSVEARLGSMKRVLEKQGASSKNYGSVGCFTGSYAAAGKKIPIATCFLDQGGYLGLQLHSEDGKHLDFDAVKALLEKAAAKRK